MNNEDLLRSGLKEIGIPCSENQTTAFMLFLSELKKWNKTYNLTAIKRDKDIIIKHFIDSLLYLKAIPDGPLKLADMGTGAGFPGIPIKIIRPEMDITLIEPSRKKTSFLKHIIRLLKLDSIHVLDQRLEDLGNEYEEAFDIIVSRATFSIKDFIEVASPYIHKEGRLLLSKGPMVSEELEALKKDPCPVCSVKELLRFQLPFSKAERALVVLTCEKNGKIVP